MRADERIFEWRGVDRRYDARFGTADIGKDGLRAGGRSRLQKQSWNLLNRRAGDHQVGAAGCEIESIRTRIDDTQFDGQFALLPIAGITDDFFCESIATKPLSDGTTE